MLLVRRIDTDAFTHRSFYAQKLLHKGAFYTEKFLHRAALRHRSFYTQRLERDLTTFHSWHGFYRCCTIFLQRLHILPSSVTNND